MQRHTESQMECMVTMPNPLIDFTPLYLCWHSCTSVAKSSLLSLKHVLKSIFYTKILRNKGQRAWWQVFSFGVCFLDRQLSVVWRDSHSCVLYFTHRSWSFRWENGFVQSPTDCLRTLFIMCPWTRAISVHTELSSYSQPSLFARTGPKVFRWSKKKKNTIRCNLSPDNRVL